MEALKINIDLNEILDEFRLSNEQMKTMVESVKQSLTLEIHRNWVEAAGKELNSTRSNYIKGLKIIDFGEGKAGIQLVGRFNNMLENGAVAFDMKSGFAKSSKVKMSKKGNWYMSIPFRWATTGAIGENEVFSGVLPPEIYAILKTKANKEGIGIKDLATEFLQKKTRAATSNALGATFNEYVHKSSVYEGIVRSLKTFPSGAQQSTYNSFRTVSALSDPSAFIHKGIKQYNLAQQAIENTDADTIVNNVVDRSLSEFGF